MCGANKLSAQPSSPPIIARGCAERPTAASEPRGGWWCGALLAPWRHVGDQPELAVKADARGCSEAPRASSAPLPQRRRQDEDLGLSRAAIPVPPYTPSPSCGCFHGCGIRTLACWELQTKQRAVPVQGGVLLFPLGQPLQKR